jgi:hypothetical protein
MHISSWGSTAAELGSDWGRLDDLVDDRRLAGAQYGALY